jgi:osmotically inducible lipoprotein OsmB
MFRKALLVSLAGVVLAQGCCSWDEENREGAVTGGLLGAAGGIIIGSMTGSWVWGGLIGGSMGALAGYVIADNSKDKPKAEPAEYPVGAARMRQEADREFKVAMEAKDSRSAEFHLRESIKFCPTPAAHNNLGIIQLQQGDRASARASFRSAILLDPGYDPALKNLEKLGA